MSNMLHGTAGASKMHLKAIEQLAFLRYDILVAQEIRPKNIIVDL